jgi:sugar-specific transcriptional regulator TrmB
MKYTSSLRQLGMSKDSAVVYETLLREGQLSVLKLSHLTEIHRPGLYALLPRMINRGLVVEVKKGRRTEYAASSPRKLESLVENTRNTLESIVEDLNNEFSRKQVVPKIEAYYGKDGIGRVFMDVVTTLDKNETFYRYSIRKDIYKDFLPRAYRQLRDEKKIERLAITNDSGAERKKPKLDRFVKVLKGSYDIFNVTKMIYANKIAFIDYENEVAFIVHNEQLASMEKQVFLSLYKML